MDVKTAIIIAGGFGTRLQSVVKDLPKPMAPINGKPFLEILTDRLSKQGIQNFTWNINNIASGNYFCNITVGNYTSTIQIIVNK